jgi:hypothetical protein
MIPPKIQKEKEKPMWRILINNIPGPTLGIMFL